MQKGYFPVSEQEQDAQGIVKGMSYNERRLGVFRTKDALLQTKADHPLCFATHSIIVEIDIPENSVRSYPDPNKFSFGPGSGAIVTDVCSVEKFEQTLVMAVI